MFVKTKMDSFLSQDVNNFSFGNKNYITSNLTDNLKQVFYDCGTIFQPNLIFIGIYDVKQNGFVLGSCNQNHFNTFANVIDFNTTDYEDIYSLRNKLYSAIQNEFENISKFVSKRGEKNDLYDSNYLNLIKTKATDYFLHNEEPEEVSIDKNLISINDITDKNLLDSLTDINDVAYEITENYTNTNSDCFYSQYLVLDIKNELTKMSKNVSDEVKSEKKIWSIINSKHVNISVIVKQFNNENGKIEKNKTLKLKTEDLKNLPIEVIKEIYWRKTKLYDYSDYQNVKEFNWDNIPCRKNTIGTYRLANFIPEIKLNDFDFILKNVNTAYLLPTTIPDIFLNDKDKVLQLLNNSRYYTIDIYSRLNDTLKSDVEIYSCILNNVSNLRYIPETVKNKEDFQLYVLNLMDFSYWNELDKENCLDMNNKCIYDLMRRKIMTLNKKNLYDKILSINIISKFTDIDIIYKLIETHYLIEDNYHLLNDKILNNIDFWTNLKVDNTQYNYLNCNIFSKLSNQIINDDEILSKIFNICQYNVYDIILNSIGFKEFRKRKNLQKLSMLKKFNFVSQVDKDICEDIIFEYVKNKKNIDFCELFKRSDINIDEMTEKIVDINQYYFYKIFNETNNSYRNAKKISNKTLKRIFDKYPSIVNNLQLSIYDEKTILLLSEYISVIPMIMGKYKNKRLKLNKEVLLKSLEHDFSTFTQIEKPLLYENNYQSVLTDKDFIIDAFKLKTKDSDAFDAVNYLIKIKSELLKDKDVLKTILLNHFNSLYAFKRTVYNNKELIEDVIKNSSEDKKEIENILKNIGSKLIKDTDILNLLH